MGNIIITMKVKKMRMMKRTMKRMSKGILIKKNSRYRCNHASSRQKNLSAKTIISAALTGLHRTHRVYNSSSNSRDSNHSNISSHHCE